ncbi:MAG: EpsI family protein [Kiritimatiellales bacterium]|nr:EpsI family protein [Kiritimatiellales bacterium]
MEKSIFKPFLTVVILMVLASLALAFTVDVKLVDKPGVVMHLPESLVGWVGNELRFCHNEACYSKPAMQGQYFVRDLELPDICPDCGEKLYTMSWAEYDALPKDTEFVKSAYTNAAGGRIFTSIVLSGMERNSIHRPQRCLVGQGNTIVNEHTMEVPMEGRAPLKVAVIEAERLYNTPDGPQNYLSYYAYWFVGQDRETPSHYARMFWLGWDRVVRSVSHRWAYIAVSGKREAKGREYEKEIAAFVQEVYPPLLVNNAGLQGTATP